ncbi:MAG: hypothetical protein CM15mP59_2140 [Flavobacteriaceae bacterium]|nr:MAG: hypothetical protein CM15mP59_2140 [Flavobacteriaceae bacterium]
MDLQRAYRSSITPYCSISTQHVSCQSLVLQANRFKTSMRGSAEIVSKKPKFLEKVVDACADVLYLWEQVILQTRFNQLWNI